MSKKITMMKKKNNLTTAKGRAAQAAQAKKPANPVNDFGKIAGLSADKILHRHFTVEEVMTMFCNKLIEKPLALELLNLPADTIFEKHPVSIKTIGVGGSIGLLNLFGDGSALFMPTDRSKTIKKFEDTGLTFTIEPVSLNIEDSNVDKSEGVKNDDEADEDTEELTPEDMKA